MTRDELTALLGRVEQATGPDPDLDKAIAAAFHLKQLTYVWPNWIIDPPFTASLDAIVDLIERELPNYKWGIHQPRALFRGYVSEQSALRLTPITADASTPALALCAAFLRAKLAQVTE